MTDEDVRVSRLFLTVILVTVRILLNGTTTERKISHRDTTHII